jgi:hypothetical protein
MSNNINRIKAELESMGFETRLFDSPQGEVVSFAYNVETGSHEGQEVMLGICMQGREPYPEYPPHWIHVTPPVDDRKGGVVERYRDAEGREWSALSRPPGEIWDQLPTKHMHVYFTEHLRRFWNGV